MPPEKAKRVLFIGNGLNRIVRSSGSDSISWDGLMAMLEEALPSDWKCREEEDASPLPLSVRAERLNNLAYCSDFEQKEVQKAWNDWYAGLVKLQPTSFMHDMLSKRHFLFENILTTNYDYALERCMSDSFEPHATAAGNELEKNLCRRYGKVWHIHGEAAIPESIVMNRKSYLDAVAAASGKSMLETWLSVFLSSEVFVCGFNPGHDEHLFWYALNERLKLAPSERKPVVVYLFCVSEQDAVSCSVLQTLFKSYDAEVEIIRVAENNGLADFCSGWKTLLGDLLLRCAGVSESPVPTSVEVSPFPEQPRKGGRHFVVSGKVTIQNPSRCWMNIRTDKLPEDAKGSFLFDCLIQGRRYVYHCGKSDLLQAFRQNDVEIIRNNPERYSFYLDYSRGEIYATVSSNDTHVVISLDSVKDAAEYRKIVEQK